jgi:16S rRNA G966 N2-methylase RsmD
MTVIRSTRRMCSDRCRKQDSRRRLAEALQKVKAAEREKAILKEANRIKRERKESKRAARQADVAERSAAMKRVNIGGNYEVKRLSVTDIPTECPKGLAEWVICDPPYPAEYLPLYSDLSRAAKHMLKPGGLLICMTGHAHLKDNMARLSEHLTYHWTMCYMMGGQAANMHVKHANVGWKPVLLYSNGPYTGPWFGDVCNSKANDKEHHHWGQSESGMMDLVKRFVKPGDLVVDPFLGGGTTGVAALLSGAFFMGYDVDQECVDTAKVRLSKLAADINASNKAAA